MFKTVSKPDFPKFEWLFDVICHLPYARCSDTPRTPEKTSAGGGQRTSHGAEAEDAESGESTERSRGEFGHPQRG